MNHKHKNYLFVATLAMLLFVTALEAQAAKIAKAQKINSTTVELYFDNGQTLTLDFYGNNIFRYFCDPAGGMLRAPQSEPAAQILVAQPRKSLQKLELKDADGTITVNTGTIAVAVDKSDGTFAVTNLATGKKVVSQKCPTQIADGKVQMTLNEQPGEYFYGGGVQNGRFSHKGSIISIENQNSWTDGGVCSPAPFYWSTGGYGFMAYTFAPGSYDFGATEKGAVSLTHKTDYADFFVMVDETPEALLKDYYQLTGNPVLLPKFGFYEGHLNAYNRDYWKESKDGTSGILFEDGKRYVESQKDQSGTRESLNGEKGNYQFSARGVIDRYAAHDMPLGWILPNDGYGAGYGQTETLDGNIQNLKEFGDYARSKGVEVGLWTQSDLHPKAGVNALLQRDLIKEVRDAGVRVLKTDVAWVGAGYSFGLNGITDAAAIMSYYGNEARPFIITLDGWAGTQRYGAVWSGDQTGGEWEYIRFHIPTYIGSGLAGEPNITSDMDGIFGGQAPIINIRDFQWKAFTPMQLNMDGWGRNEKYPHALGEPAASINRTYLKLKSQLIPYTYSIAHTAVTGLPMIQAMFLQYPDAYTYGNSTCYQYMYGPWFLVAPIYEETQADAEGNDIRNGIYLPQGNWIDYFTGQQYRGGRILNDVQAPIWKLPLFVKAGAIIPMTTPNNNVKEINKSLRMYELYPAGKSSFTEYDDDGTTLAYERGEGATTLIESDLDAKGNLTVTLHPAQGKFDGMVKEKSTQLCINVTEQPKSISAKVGKKKIALKEAASLTDFEKGENLYFYDATPQLNRFATRGSDYAGVSITKNPQLLIKTGKSDITAESLTVTVKGYRYAPASQTTHRGTLQAPAGAGLTASGTGVYSLTTGWHKVENADYYEIEYNGMLYSTITGDSLQFTGLKPQTEYAFKVRAVNSEGCSPWSDFTAKTKVDPLEWAIRGIQAWNNKPDQGGQGVNHLFDFDEKSMWHTRWQAKAVPFELTLDLQTVNSLDKLQYLPRESGGNGVLKKGVISYSMDRKSWNEAGSFDWAANGEAKEFVFTSHPQARYLKIAVSEGVGDFGSGREMYIFKVPGSASYLQGDANSDGKIDENDLTSYTNYTGLRRGDSDFEGYISRADVNNNGLIDAYDISLVGTYLEGGIIPDTLGSVRGSLQLTADKKSYLAGDTVRITVKGINLNAVNALSFALPYDATEYSFAGVQLLHTGAMMNLTNDRLHTNGNKSLYPTLVNIGSQEVIGGSNDLFVIKMVARKSVKFNLKATDGLLVDKWLNTVSF